jgi:hypothetical protein
MVKIIFVIKNILEGSHKRRNYFEEIIVVKAIRVCTELGTTTINKRIYL